MLRVFQRSFRSSVFSRRLYGVAANKGVESAELRQRVADWKLPFSYHPGGLTEVEYDQLHQDGFVIKQLFEPEELKDALVQIEALVDDLAQLLYYGGKIKNLYEEHGVFQRLTHIEKEFEDAGVLLHKQGVLPAAFQQLWTHPRLISIARQVIGSEIAGHPVWNLRCKTPQTEHSVVPWHQDTAYLDPSCWSTFQLTAWIPMLDATTENGCMEVLRGGHRTGRTAHHTCVVGNTWYVDLPQAEIEKTLEVSEKDSVVCEVPLGSVLFLNNLIPHRSLSNTSEDIRWSFDFRFQKPQDATGFENVKPFIMLHSESTPNFQVDWSEWAVQNRTEGQEEAVSGSTLDDQFDTRIAGPWMLQWEMTHTNKHTDLLLKSGDDVSFTKA